MVAGSQGLMNLYTASDQELLVFAPLPLLVIPPSLHFLARYMLNLLSLTVHGRSGERRQPEA